MYPKLYVLILGAFTISLGFGSAAVSTDPLIGTWKLNVAKSKYSPGPPPRSATIKYEAAGGDALRNIRDEMEANGRTIHSEYTSKFDGKDYPVSGPLGGGNPPRGTITAKRINVYTTVNINKLDGKVTSTSRRIVSKDGKTLTIIVKGTDGHGHRINNRVVYDRVE